MIHEYPLISIDNFRSLNSEIYILSHAHEDHTIGLQKKSFKSKVYCSQTTKNMLLSFKTNYGNGEYKYKHLTDFLIPIVPEQPVKLKYGNSNVWITLINTHHCPGSNLILVQSDFASPVIYTGDIRCDDFELQSLQRSHALLKVFNSPVTLYVDSTFMNHEDIYKEYKPNSEGIEDLLKLIEKYPKDLHFCICDLVTGHEDVIISICRFLKTKIHMDDYFYNLFKSANILKTKELLSYCSIDLEECRLHYCHKQNGCPKRDPEMPTVYLKACNQPSKEIVQMQNTILSKHKLPTGIMTSWNGSQHIYEGPTQRYFLQNSQFYPLFPFYYFSRHTSMPEMKRFVSMFTALKVYDLWGKPLDFQTGDLKPGLVTSYFNRKEISTLETSDHSQILLLLNNASEEHINQVDPQACEHACEQNDDTVQDDTVQDNTIADDTIADEPYMDPQGDLLTHLQVDPLRNSFGVPDTDKIRTLESQLASHPTLWFDLCLKCLNK